MIYAHHTAHKVGAMVCVPDFSSLKDTENNATDFNDLHQLSGLQAIRDTIPQKPDLNIALLHALIKHNDYALGVLSTKNFRYATRINYNNKYLPEIDFSEGVHLVRSPIGSGKTDNIKSFLGKNPQHKALYITHLVALIEDAVARLNLINYNDCDIHDLHIEDMLAICLNSLHKFSALNNIPLFDVVIVDEVEQVLARLTTNMANKVLVFKVLQHIMNSAKILICLDAHLSKTTVDFIKTLSSDKKINIHINHYTDPKKSKYVSYQNAESLQFAGMQAIEDDKKAYISFNSKAEAFKTYSAFKAAFPEKRGLYISSDNAGDLQVKAFLKDVNVEVLNYDSISTHNKTPFWLNNKLIVNV